MAIGSNALDPQQVLTAFVLGGFQIRTGSSAIAPMRMRQPHIGWRARRGRGPDITLPID
jgi:hypothetical protein